MAGELFIFGSFVTAFLVFLLGGLLLFLGQIWGTYNAFTREDLSNEQKLVFIAAFWIFAPTWIVYLFLGRERTSRILDGLDFL